MKVSKSTRQFLMYFFACLVIFVGSFLLVAFAQGYGFDFRSGQIYSTGLVLINSSPGSATIELGGKQISEKTPHRIDNAPIGELLISLTKQNHRKWSARKIVSANQVTFIDYALLLPDVLSRRSVASASAYKQIVQSANSERTFGINKEANQVYLIEPNGTARQVFASSALFPTITGVTLSQSGERFIVQVSNGTQNLQILANINSNEQLNLSEAYGSFFDLVWFNPSNSTELFILQNKSVKKLTTSSKSIAVNSLSNIVSFAVFQDRVIYLEQPVNQPRPLVKSANLGLSNSQTLLEAPVAQPYQIEFIQSARNEYLALLGANKSLLLVREPYREKVSSLVSTGALEMKISPNKRYFTYLNTDNKIKTIDLEEGRYYSSPKLTSPITSMTWYDGNHLFLQGSSGLEMIDYDGQNLQPIIQRYSGLSFTQSSKQLLMLNEFGGLFSLSLSE